jgi:4-hydroxy-tetrahydrodipicolinate synthase
MKIINDLKNNIEGVIVPVITPIDSKECVDVEAFKAVLDHCIDAGVNGIFVGGSAGMGPLLTDEQWQTAIETAADYVHNRCILLGGIICTSTARAIQKIKVLEKCNYRYMAVTPTYYITLNTNEQFLTHFRACKDATEMEMVVYNIPSCTYSDIPIDVLEKMAAEGLYRTLKESSGDREYFKNAIEIGNHYDLTILQGNEPDISWGLEIGAGGIVPVCANYKPNIFLKAYKAALEDDQITLRNQQEHIDYIRNILLVKPQNWIGGIMYGMASLGIGNGIPLRPLQEITQEAKNNIDSLSLTKIKK